MGAFGVLLLRITHKRFSATQYALFSSLFGLPRLLAGPITGFTVPVVGWTNFFWLTMVAGIPGMLLLARFAPLGTREPTFTVEPPRYRDPLSAGSLVVRGFAGGMLAAILAVLIMASLSAMDALASGGAESFELARFVGSILYPSRITDVLQLLGAVVAGAVCGLLTAAVFAARHGAAAGLEKD
jgi:PAT family beta-lactamase induction signal transducer AmpG